VDLILRAVKKIGSKRKAMAHITGGGLLENIPRVLPPGVCAQIDIRSWPRPPLFTWLQQQGNIVDNEMYRTFNNGIGLVLCVAPQQQEMTLTLLHELGETAWKIGQIVAHPDEKIRFLEGL
jgi:phosphoribosylformylglycinamidine cyclo-ligase